MRILLDTCTFLWLVGDAPKLSSRAREVFEGADNDVYLSTASAWEIAVKHRLGRLPLPSPPADFVPRQREAHGVDALAVDEPAALHVALLPDLHRDPFDRILVAQSLVHGLAIMTPDKDIAQYAVPTVW